MKKTQLVRKTPLKTKTAKKHPARRSKLTAKAPKKPKVTALKKLLWNECKRIVRARHGYNCYTCGKYTEAPHTGHFIPSSVCSAEMRYSLENLRPQCFACNIHKSGNWPAYEAHLIIDYGQDYPEQLKQHNRDTIGRQYDSLWYLSKIDEYRLL